MTDREINIAIAEACGAKWIAYGHWKSDTCWLTPGWKIPACIKTGGHIASLDDHDVGGVLSEDIPDYCNDLNAMNEAEKAVLWSDNALWPKYTDNLNLLSKSLAPALHAAARQRAEAFLRTKGLWQEGSE